MKYETSDPPQMDAMSLGDESDAETRYMEMLEYILDGSKSHLSVNRRKVY